MASLARKSPSSNCTCLKSCCDSRRACSRVRTLLRSANPSPLRDRTFLASALSFPNCTRFKSCCDSRRTCSRVCTLLRSASSSSLKPVLCLRARYHSPIARALNLAATTGGRVRVCTLLRNANSSSLRASTLFPARLHALANYYSRIACASNLAAIAGGRVGPDKNHLRARFHYRKNDECILGQFNTAISKKFSPMFRRSLPSPRDHRRLPQDQWNTVTEML